MRVHKYNALDSNDIALHEALDYALATSSTIWASVLLPIMPIEVTQWQTAGRQTDEPPAERVSV